MSSEKRKGGRQRPERSSDEDWLDDPQIDDLISSAKTLPRSTGKSKKRSKPSRTSSFQGWIQQTEILPRVLCVIWGVFSVLAIWGWLAGFELVFPTLFLMAAAVFLAGLAWMFMEGVNAGGADFVLRVLFPFYRWTVPHPGYAANSRNPLMLMANGVFVGAGTFGLALLLHPGRNPPPVPGVAPAVAGSVSGNSSSLPGSNTDQKEVVATNPERENNVTFNMVYEGDGDPVENIKFALREFQSVDLQSIRYENGKLSFYHLTEKMNAYQAQRERDLFRGFLGPDWVESNKSRKSSASKSRQNSRSKKTPDQSTEPSGPGVANLMMRMEGPAEPQSTARRVLARFKNIDQASIVVYPDNGMIQFKVYDVRLWMKPEEQQPIMQSLKDGGFVHKTARAATLGQNNSGSVAPAPQNAPMQTKPAAPKF